jgi:hypothetical protein
MLLLKVLNLTHEQTKSQLIKMICYELIDVISLGKGLVNSIRSHNETPGSDIEKPKLEWTDESIKRNFTGPEEDFDFLLGRCKELRGETGNEG